MGCQKLRYYPENHLENTLYARQNRVWKVYIREEYTPFGSTSFGSYGKKRYRFCGKEKDEESGLYNYGARYYSPWMCRFVQVDPLAAKHPNKTPYHYASNNPINRVDPSGMEDEPSGGGGGGGGGDGGKNGEGKSIGSQTRDNTSANRPPVTREMLQAVNNGASNENSAIPAQKDFSNISVVEPVRQDNTRQAYTEKANLRTGAAVNTQKAAQANRSAAAEKRVSEAPSLTATPRLSSAGNPVVQNSAAKNSPPQSKSEVKAQSNGGIYSGNNIFAKSYTHFQIGGGNPLHVSTSALDFSGVTQKNLVYNSKTNTYGLDLYKVNPTSQTALVFGKITPNSPRLYRGLKEKGDFIARRLFFCTNKLEFFLNEIRNYVW